jgi:imidazolonepropionase
MASDGADAYGTIRDGLVAVSGARIAWVGPAVEAPDTLFGPESRVLDLQGGWVTPGLIDAHTHLVFGGTRADEFERRLAGVSYEEIARDGGGILATVRATRDADVEELTRAASRRMGTLVDHGVTGLEIKSGYGLDLDTEIRMLEVARDLAALHGVAVSTTLLAAHALPTPYADHRAGYLDLVCDEMIPEVARRGLADAVDAFCEGIAFTVDECERVLRAGQGYGLAARLHADQLSDLGGAALAARVGARSADHLEYTSEAGVRAMAAAGTAAVLLPGAFYFLGADRAPPVASLRREGVPIVVATDLNPGSSPVLSPLLAMNLASVLFGLTPSEALAGMTREAAPILGWSDRGVLREGARADLACWSVAHPAELCYWIGGNPCQAVVCGGRRIR